MSFRTAIYARISEDRADGAGVGRQVEDSRRECERHPEWGPPVEFVDNGTSAWRPGSFRPRYTAMLEGVRSGDIGRIVAYHVDRLYRRPRELEELIELADAGRVQMVTVSNGDLQLDTSDGRFLSRILVNVAAKESDDRSRRIRRQKRQRREEGRPSGGARAFGWADKMTPHPVEAPQLAHAVEALIAGESLIGVARQWNEAQVLQPQTGRANWTPNGIRQMVLNPRHAGLMGYRPHKHEQGGRRKDSHEIEIIGPALWPAIVPRERWEILRAKLTDRERHVPRRRSLLTGLLVCGRCGARMVRGSMRRKEGYRPIWRCPLVLPRRGCGNNTIDGEGVENLVTAAVFAAFDAGGLNLKDDSQDSEPGRLTHRLAELEARRATLADSFADARLSLSAFERADGTIENELLHLREELAALSRRATMSGLVTRGERLQDVWEDLSPDARHAVLEVAIKRVVISPAVKRGLPAFDRERVERIEWRA